MMRNRQQGFTFVEILVVVALIGVMATCALAPMAHMVGLLRDSQSSAGERAAVDDVFRLICRDVRSQLLLPERAYLAVRHRDLFGGNADDLLVVASGSVLQSSLAPGVMVYGLLREDSLGMRSVLPGLYRWVFPGKGIEDLDLKGTFPLKKAALVLPGVESFRVEVFVEKDWVDEYLGAMPLAIRMTLERRGETYETTDWFPIL